MSKREKMSDEKLRMKIAGLLGWNRPKNVVSEFWDKKNPLMFCPPGALMYYGNTVEIPDWPNDLNAMHEAEEQLWKKGGGLLWRDYVVALRSITDGRFEVTDLDVRPIFATARERAKAFVLVMKWEESRGVE